jgi:hypothetical protein
MKNTIQTIIQSKIPKGSIFDAHSIIEYLIQCNSDTYLSFYQNNWKTEFFHSEISKLIATFDGELIERKGTCWSQNIHKRFTSNACWLKK